MQYRYLISHHWQLEGYCQFVQRAEPRIEEFLSLLQSRYEVTELPRVVILTDRETATKLISDLPVPAFTNDVRTVFCPELAVWKEIYLAQLSNGENGELEGVRAYYESCITEHAVQQILGHEFVHHSNLFLDDVYETSIWFEEGMCEYISRKFFFTPEEFQQEKTVNAILTSHYEATHGSASLEKFGHETYQQGYADIFYGYWKSFLAVDTLIEKYNGSVLQVFQEYHRWHTEKSSKTLAQWFGLEA